MYLISIQSGAVRERKKKIEAVVITFLSIIPDDGIVIAVGYKIFTFQ